MLRRADNVARLSNTALDGFTAALFCFQCYTLSFSHTHTLFLQCFQLFHVEHYFVTFNFIIMENQFNIERALASLQKSTSINEVLCTVGIYFQSLDFREQLYFMEEAEKLIRIIITKKAP